MRVKDVMTQKVISVLPQTTIADAIDIMVRSHVSGLPVVQEDGTLVGIVSEGDLLRRPELGTQKKPGNHWLQRLFNPGQLAEEYARSHGRYIEEIMTTRIATVDESLRLDEAAALMEKHGIKRLPVVRDNKLVGIVSRADFVRALAGFLRPAYESQPISDQAIKETIIAELKAEPWAPVGTISIEVKGGVVELNGVITDEKQRNAIRVLVGNTDGVLSVRDNLSWLEPFSGTVTPPPKREDSGEAA